MAIPAKRFTILDYESNVGFNELLEKKDSGILNSEQNDTLEITQKIQSFVDTAIVDPIVFDQIKDVGSAASRVTKGLGGVIEDVKSLPAKELEKKLSSVIPNPALNQALMSGLNLNCKQNNFGINGLGKPYDLNINCNGRNNKTNAGCANNGQITGVLNKLTNGAYNAVYNDLNLALKNLLALSMYGYSLNMCGIFDAFSMGITDKGVLNRGSAGVLTALTNTKNTLGVFDIANAVNIKNLTPKLEFPGVVNKVLSNFKTGNFKENELSDINDRVFAAAEVLDTKWKTSDFDNSIALDIAALEYNNDLCNTMAANNFKNIPDENSLNSIPDTDQNYINTVYLGSRDSDNGFNRNNDELSSNSSNYFDTLGYV